MASSEEKSDFSKRLRLALNRGPKPVKGATDLARRFNLRHTEGAGISVQTAHKWLNGLTMPTADKLKTLAQWLEVSEHWLHYGPPPEPMAVSGGAKLPPATASLVKASKVTLPPLVLAERIGERPEPQRYLLEELIAQFYKLSRGSA